MACCVCQAAGCTLRRPSPTKLAALPSAPLLVSLAGQPCSPSPLSFPSFHALRASMPPPSVVVRDLHQRVRANREDLGTFRSTCVDEHDLACVDYAKAKSFINKPLNNDQPASRLWSCQRGLQSNWLLARRRPSRRSLSQASPDV